MAMIASQQRGLEALRRSTLAFIADDPYSIELQPKGSERVKKPGGGFDFGDGLPPKPAQRFKLVAASGGSFDGDGKQGHKWDYALIGAWNADIEIGDTWVDGNTQYRVASLMQNNGYEKVAAVVAVGTDPNYG